MNRATNDNSQSGLAQGIAPAKAPKGEMFGGAPRRKAELTIRIFFTAAGFMSLIIMALIVLFLFKEGLGIVLNTEIRRLEVSIGGDNPVVLTLDFPEGKGPSEYFSYEEDPDIIEFVAGDPALVRAAKLKIEKAFQKVRGAPLSPRPLLRVEPVEKTTIQLSKIAGFLFGAYWYPNQDTPEFGILPLLLGSLAITLLSALLAVPLGVGSALYLTEVAGGRMREFIKPVIELLAGLPTVILGFIGLVVLAPLMQRYLGIPSGLNLLSASLILAVMAIPTITSISEDALHSVPQELIEASLALGATRWETLTRVQVPGALSGIGTAAVLGMSRVLGETMVVLMVAGGAAQIPGGLFDSVRPLPATIAAEMGETPVGSDHYFALFAIGIVLFILTLGFNLLATRISNRFQQKGTAAL
jgi:phosphate transport system permease protein